LMPTCIARTLSFHSLRNGTSSLYKGALKSPDDISIIHNPRSRSGRSFRTSLASLKILRYASRFIDKLNEEGVIFIPISSDCSCKSEWTIERKVWHTVENVSAGGRGRRVRYDPVPGIARVHWKDAGWERECSSTRMRKMSDVSSGGISRMPIA
jgi:hypothetical protein